VIHPLSIADEDTLRAELGELLVGDLDIIRGAIYHHAYPVDPIAREAIERFFKGYRVPVSKDAKKVEE